MNAATITSILAAIFGVLAVGYYIWTRYQAAKKRQANQIPGPGPRKPTPPIRPK